MRRRRACGRGNYALAFGVGLLVGMLCPAKLIIIITAVIIIILAIAASKC